MNTDYLRPKITLKRKLSFSEDEYDFNESESEMSYASDSEVYYSESESGEDSEENPELLDIIIHGKF